MRVFIMYDVDEESLKIGKFLRGFGNIRTPITMIYGVSIGNERQTGNDLISFINLVNINTPRFINGVEIMIADYLHRHYSTEEESQKSGDNWIIQNSELLKKLKVPYKIVRWKDITQEEDFKVSQIKISELFEKDLLFKSKLQNVTKSHKDKGVDTDVEKYLLEECAYFIYKNGYLTYPSDKLNAACMHLLQKYNSDLIFLPHALQERKKSDEFKPLINQTNKNHPSYSNHSEPPRTNNYSYPEELVISCAQTSLLMQRYGFHKVEQREQFFSQYLKSVQPCLQLVPDIIDSSSRSITHEEISISKIGFNNSGQSN
jgi:hypothetical protein